MRGYSGANLLVEEQQERGFWSQVVYSLRKSKYVELEVDIPLAVYKRSLVFCRDIEDLGYDFKNKDLVKLLYDDFLKTVKKGQSMEKWYWILLEGDRMTRPIQIYQNNEELSPVYPSMYEKSAKQEPRYACLTIALEYNAVLRGEWFLRDMDEVFSDHPFTIEKVIQIIYCDFIYRHQRGDTKVVVSNIIKHLEKELDED